MIQYLNFKGGVMKKNILLMVFVFLVTACETGTRYEKNATKFSEPKDSESGLIDNNIANDIDALLYSDEERGNRERFDADVHPIVHADSEPSQVVQGTQLFEGGIVTDGLDVVRVRKGKHEGFERLVFDIDFQNSAQSAAKVGNYTAKYNGQKKDIVVIMNGYRKFSAKLPSFSNASVIKQMYFEQYLDDSAFKLHIKLREHAKVRVFSLSHPARLVFDIKAI